MKKKKKEQKVAPQEEAPQQTALKQPLPPQDETKEKEKVQEEQQRLDKLKEQEGQHNSTISHTNGLIDASEKKISGIEEDILEQVNNNNF